MQELCSHSFSFINTLPHFVQSTPVSESEPSVSEEPLIRIYSPQYNDHYSFLMRFTINTIIFFQKNIMLHIHLLFIQAISGHNTEYY